MYIKNDKLPIIDKISSDKKCIPVFLSISNEYFPFFSVLLVSLAKNVSLNEFLDIIVFSDDMLNEDNRKCSNEILEVYRNFSLRFVNVGDLTKNWNPYIRGHVTKMTYFRFLAPFIMIEYDKAIYLDGDTLAVNDIGKLYDIDLEENMLAAVKDPAMAGIYTKGDQNVVNLINDVIKLDNPFDYFQAGVLSVNLKLFREQYTLQFLTDLCEKKCWRYVDQDVLNYLCKGRVKFLDNEWNVETKSALKLPLQYAPKDIKELYNSARLKPSIIHYAGVEKPWNSVNSDYSKIYEMYAKESSLYTEKFLASCSKNLKTDFVKLSTEYNASGVFFRCTTPFHLFNAINIKISSYSNCSGYVVLSSDIDWKNIPDNLTKTKIFDDVVISKSSRDVSSYNSLIEEEKYSVADNPSKWLMGEGFEDEIRMIQRHKNITDLFFALNSKTEWLLYYACCDILDNNPNVHLFEEGSMSYIFNNIEYIKQNDFVSRLTHRKAYIDSLTEFAVYSPELIINEKIYNNIVQLPQVSANNTILFDTLISVFGSPNLPKEKFIYFDSPGFENKADYVSFDILDRVADVVGKENIIVKLHPRTTINRYSVRGYKIMNTESPLWEINCFDPKFRDKAYISMLSTAVLNCHSVFGVACNAVNLYKLNPLCKDIFLLQNGANKIIKKIFESNSPLIKTFKEPKNFDELREILLYLKGGNELI